MTLDCIAAHASFGGGGAAALRVDTNDECRCAGARFFVARELWTKISHIVVGRRFRASVSNEKVRKGGCSTACTLDDPMYVPGYLPGYVPEYLPGYIPGYLPGYGQHYQTWYPGTPQYIPHAKHTLRWQLRLCGFVSGFRVPDGGKC